MGPLSERYLTTLSGLGAGLAVYSMDAVLKPRYKLVFFALLVSVFGILALTQEYQIIQTMASRRG